MSKELSSVILEQLASVPQDILSNFLKQQEQKIQQQNIEATPSPIDKFEQFMISKNLECSSSKSVSEAMDISQYIHPTPDLDVDRIILKRIHDYQIDYNQQHSVKVLSLPSHIRQQNLAVQGYRIEHISAVVNAYKLLFNNQFTSLLFLQSHLKISQPTAEAVLRFYLKQQSSMLNRYLVVTDITDICILSTFSKKQIFAAVTFLGIDYQNLQDSFFYFEITDLQTSQMKFLQKHLQKLKSLLLDIGSSTYFHQVRGAVLQRLQIDLQTKFVLFFDEAITELKIKEPVEVTEVVQPFQNAVQTQQKRLIVKKKTDIMTLYGKQLFGLDLLTITIAFALCKGSKSIMQVLKQFPQFTCSSKEHLLLEYSDPQQSIIKEIFAAIQFMGMSIKSADYSGNTILMKFRISFDEYDQLFECGLLSVSNEIFTVINQQFRQFIQKFEELVSSCQLSLHYVSRCRNKLQSALAPEPLGQVNDSQVVNTGQVELVSISHEDENLLMLYLNAATAAYRYQDLRSNFFKFVQTTLQQLQVFNESLLSITFLKTFYADHEKQLKLENFIAVSIKQLFINDNEIFCLVNWLGFPESKDSVENYVKLLDLEQEFALQELADQKLSKQLQRLVLKLPPKQMVVYRKQFKLLFQQLDSEEPQVQKEGRKRGRPKRAEREPDNQDADSNLPFSLSVLEGLVAAFKFQHIDADMIQWIKDKMMVYLSMADINSRVIRTAIKDNQEKFSDDAYVVERVQEFSSLDDKMFVLVDWLGFPPSKRKPDNFVDVSVLDDDDIRQLLQNEKLLDQFRVQFRKLSKSAQETLQRRFQDISGALSMQLCNTVLEVNPLIIQGMFNTFKHLKLPAQEKEPWIIQQLQQYYHSKLEPLNISDQLKGLAVAKMFVPEAIVSISDHKLNEISSIYFQFRWFAVPADKQKLFPQSIDILKLSELESKMFLENEKFIQQAQRLLSSLPYSQQCDIHRLFPATFTIQEPKQHVFGDVEHLHLYLHDQVQKGQVRIEFVKSSQIYRFLDIQENKTYTFTFEELIKSAKLFKLVFQLLHCQ